MFFYFATCFFHPGNIFPSNLDHNNVLYFVILLKIWLFEDYPPVKLKHFMYILFLLGLLIGVLSFPRS